MKLLWLNIIYVTVKTTDVYGIRNKCCFLNCIKLKFCGVTDYPTKSYNDERINRFIGPVPVCDFVLTQLWLYIAILYYTCYVLRASKWFREQKWIYYTPCFLSSRLVLVFQEDVASWIFHRFWSVSLHCSIEMEIFKCDRERGIWKLLTRQT
jgi:hypothetical protein